MTSLLIALTQVPPTNSPNMNAIFSAFSFSLNLEWYIWFCAINYIEILSNNSQTCLTQLLHTAWTCHCMHNAEGYIFFQFIKLLSLNMHDSHFYQYEQSMTTQLLQICSIYHNILYYYFSLVLTLPLRHCLLLTPFMGISIICNLYCQPSRIPTPVIRSTNSVPKVNSWMVSCFFEYCICYVLMYAPLLHVTSAIVRECPI